jgi:hypothetical protein
MKSKFHWAKADLIEDTSRPCGIEIRVIVSGSQRTQGLAKYPQNTKQAVASRLVTATVRLKLLSIGLADDLSTIGTRQRGY